jgi:uncharacterized repeat protein (TIGR03847 family)
LLFMPVIHEYDPPDRFVAGTVGQPGERTFFLQARASGRITSVALEKQQVQVLAERVNELLDQVLQSESTRTVVPAITPVGMEDNDPLDQPIEEEFRAGTMTLSWDPAAERVVIEVFPYTEEAVLAPDQVGEEVVEPEPEEIFLVKLAPAAARAFVERAQRVVEAGRPSCPFCGQPVDPDGHLCARANGFRRRDP